MSRAAAGAETRLGRYHLGEPLGGGPTGEVFRAKVYGVAGFERQFAVKRFHARFVIEPDVAAQIAAAARSYGSLEHPRVARLHEFGVAGGDTFAAVELVDGIDVARVISATHSVGHPLPLGAATALVSQAGRAIGFAHGRGLCHLGVCPTNLVCTPDGVVKVTDFGFLPPRLPDRPGEDSTLSARIPYLAPEQLVGESTSPATDVFQLGVIAYELLSGHKPFPAADAYEMAQKILNAQPAQPVGVPKPIAKVLRRCLARSPFERFPDAGAMSDAIDAAVRSTPVRGDQRDLAKLVAETCERIASMDQRSGELSFPMPAPPSPDDPVFTQETATSETPARKAASINVPAGILPPAAPPSPAPLATVDDGLTQPTVMNPEVPTEPSADAPGSMDGPTNVAPVPGSPLRPLPDALCEVDEVGLSADDIELSAAEIEFEQQPTNLAERNSSPALGGPTIPSLPPPDMQRPPSDMQDIPPDMQGVPPELQRGPPEMQSGPPEMQSGPPEMQSGPPEMQSGPPGRAPSTPPPTPLDQPPPSLNMQPPSPTDPPVPAPLLGHTLPPKPNKKGGALRLVLIVLGLGALAVLGFFGYQMITANESSSGGGSESTDATEVAVAEKSDAGSESVGTDGNNGNTAATGDAGTVAASTGDAGTAAAGSGGDAGTAATGSGGDAGTAAGSGGDAGTDDDGDDGDDGDDEDGHGTPNATKLVITSQPGRAKVYLDGTLVGKTPLELEPSADSHRVAVIKDGYKLHTGDIAGRGKVEIELAEVTPPGGPAGIKVRCKAKNRYYVFVDGYDVGQLCPTERIGVDKGEHVVEIYDPVTDSRREFRVKVKQTRNSLRVRVD